MEALLKASWPSTRTLQLATVLFELPSIEASGRQQAQVDAGVVGEILGAPWFWPRREVGRCAHHRHAEVGPDPHRHHVLRDRFSKANAGVETFRNDVRQTGFDGELHMNVGVVGQEPFENGPQHRLGCVLGRRDPDRTGRFVPEVAQRSELGRDRVKRRTERAQQPLACLGRRDTPRGPGQEPHAKPRLEAADRMAQRRLRGPELRGGAREALLLGHDRKGVQIDQFLALHP